MTFLHLNSCAVCRTLSLMRMLSRRKSSCTHVLISVMRQDACVEGAPCAAC